MKNILVVDDHPVVLEVMGALARAVFAGADVRLADSLEGAEEAARSGGRLDMVLLDLGLPGCPGISALTRFRNLRPTCRWSCFPPTRTRR